MSNKNGTEYAPSASTPMGVALGAVMVLGFFYWIYKRASSTPISQAVGHTIEQGKKTLEHSNVEGSRDDQHALQETLARPSSLMSRVIDWILNGLNLIQQFKQRG